MPWGLKRFHQSGQTQFITFGCYHRRQSFTTDEPKHVFVSALERVRRSYGLCVYGYVVMPEHVHLLLGEPQHATLAAVLKSLKQGVSRRLIGDASHFWQKRYYDFNIRDHAQFVEKLRYIHRNPVLRGLCERPQTGSGAVSATMRRAAKDEWRLSPSGRQGSANGQKRGSVQR